MNEHDKVFKEIQSVRENALDFIRGTVPEELLCLLNLDTLSLEKDSFIDPDLGEHFSDLIYSCQTAHQHKLKITLLLEHKSQKPANEHLQLLRYLINIWSHETKNHQPLSLIIPIIFYHGDSTWEARLFTERFANYAPALLRFIPEIPYLLTDLQRYDDEAIKRTLFHRDINATMALLMKYIRNSTLLPDKLAEIFIPVKQRFSHETIPAEVSSLIYYLLKISELDIARITQIISTIDPKGGEAIMTTATKLREEGKIEGKIETARRMLGDGQSIELIAKYTGLSLSEIMALQDNQS